MIETTPRRYSYTTIPNDPLKVRHYTLDNGLQVFLSVNSEEPRIYTQMAFRAGSKYDPADTTGLAHYMEHMLFKGTSQIGALDWEKESEYLERIADLFETYRATSDEEERTKIYTEIDRLSYEAAQLIAPNEYDRLMTALGAKSTNAYTWVEQTVYVNDIPSNELARWVRLERERFRHLALRLFHTELETVYEEFNMSQDKDFRKVNNKLRELLFPTHPYGTQTTLGKPEHLKNPSMRNIQAFFETYYVPNNLAICLAGEFDPDETIALIDQHFGDWKSHDFPPFTYEEQAPLDAPQRAEVFGQESPYVQMGWRLDGGRTDDYRMGLLIRQLLYNEQAGLIDLHLNQEQRVLEAEVYNWIYEDYSVFGLYGKPLEGQSLEEVEALLLAELDHLRKGEFPDWLLEAILRDMKVADLKAMERNNARVGAMTNCFVLGIPWADFVNRYDFLEKVTKEDVVRFAREKLPPEGFALVYKRQGKNPGVVKMEKPPITPAPLQREASSDFAKDFLAITPPRLAPVFADFKGNIQREEWQEGLRFDYVYNSQNPLFRLDYIFEMGKLNSLDLGLAIAYLPYLGTDRYSAAEIQQEFFRLGLHFEVYNYDERSHVSLTGLEESLEEGLQLVEHILANVQPDKEAWENVVRDILTKRANQKQDRGVILRSALRSYANYGPESPFTYRKKEENLRRLDPETLIHWIRDLGNFHHRVYYFGQKSQADAAQIIRRHHRLPEQLKAPVPPRTFTQLPTLRNEVLYTHFPMVQTDILLNSRGTPQFNLEEHTLSDLYNEYFGYGLSSIVFQEIREARALAYSTYAYYSSPNRANRAHYFRSYVGTQPDKVQEALPALIGITEDMPLIEEAVQQARMSLLQRVETDRIAPRKLYWEAQNVWDLQMDRDLLKDIYDRISDSKSEELVAFQEKHVKGRHYKLLVMGDRASTPLNFLKDFGPLRELSTEELFGF